MHWILILMLSNGFQGDPPVMSTAVFDDEAACRAAGEAVKKMSRAEKMDYICAPSKSTS